MHGSLFSIIFFRDISHLINWDPKSRNKRTHEKKQVIAYDVLAQFLRSGINFSILYYQRYL